MRGEQVDKDWIEVLSRQTTKDDLNKICGKDKDEDFINKLLWLIASLIHLPVVTTEETRDLKTGQSLTVKRSYDFRSLDSLSQTFDPNDGKIGYSLDEIEIIAAKSQKFLDDIEVIAHKYQELFKDLYRLHWTPLVQHLIYEGILPKGDLLHSFVNIERLRGIFQGVIALPSHVKQFDGRSKHDENRILGEIFTLIYERTGRYHDKELANLLSALAPKGDAKWTVAALKKRRSRRS